MSLSTRITAVVQAIGTAIKSKQDKLVSASNIKTVNGNSLLGSGDLVVSKTAIAKLTATQASTSTTLANITSLVLPMEANGVYQIQAFVTFKSEATLTGLNLGINTPSGCRNMVQITVPITSTAAASQLRTTFPNAEIATNLGNVKGTGVTAKDSAHTASIIGIIRNGATDGNCQLMFATEVDSNAITLQIGSEMHLTKVA